MPSILGSIHRLHASPYSNHSPLTSCFEVLIKALETCYGAAFPGLTLQLFSNDFPSALRIR